MEGGENHEPPTFCIEVNVPRERQKIAVLWLHHGATLQSAVEATVDLLCKKVCFNQLFGDVIIFSVVLSSTGGHMITDIDSAIAYSKHYFPQFHWQQYLNALIQHIPCGRRYTFSSCIENVTNRSMCLAQRLWLNL
jgi:hypothetical protein